MSDAGKTHPDYLPTMPAMLFEFSAAKKRDRPCWRCRFHLRWPPWRKHWQCRPPIKMRYLDEVQ